MSKIEAGKILVRCRACGDVSEVDELDFRGDKHGTDWAYICDCLGEVVEISYTEGGACASALKDAKPKVHENIWNYYQDRKGG